ncbi:MAG: bifunctional folylpolyglutamate synthase/dihydrofolate synthase [Lachnospiraceae bacterium]|nr:bifunctional folylpolyglutamate synthase/dihydrofolate synthase [Lachnospiraceae bacterium]
MTTKEAKEFLEYLRQKGSILGMESIRRLCDKIGNPQEYGRIIHIAGTNGKGSTGKLLEAAFMAAGYKVGRYSSPAVFAYEEIIQVNGKNISWEELTSLFEQLKQACDGIEDEGHPCPTSFEAETAAAFLYFKEQQCDFSIIEVGMGGRTDATNVLMNPVASVITSISKDHTGFLGNTLAEIAGMKAGIIKKCGVVIKLFQEGEVNRAIEEEITKVQGSCKNLFWARKEEYPVASMKIGGMTVQDGKTAWNFALTGACQQENIACAITTLKALEEAGVFPLSEKAEAIKEAWTQTKWPGRFEKISNKPLCIIDGCHNPDAAGKLRETVQELLKGYRIHFVIGVLKDKDYDRIFEQVLPLGVDAICVTPKGPRGLAAEELSKVAKRYLPEVECRDSVEAAVESAFEKCIKKRDMVLGFGSLSYLGEVKDYVNGICQSSDSE